MRQFCKTVLATFLGLVLFSAVGTGGLIALVWLAARPEAEKPSIRKGTILVYDLGTEVRDTPTGDGPQSLNEALEESGGESVHLRDLLRTLEAAAQDPKIVGLYLRGGESGPAIGPATLQEIRRELEAFRATGKPIWAYDDEWGEREYYLASVATTLALNPIGSLTLDGLSQEVRFYTGALQQLGVGVQVVRVGQFKAAVEPFLRRDLSPQNRQQTQALLTDLWGEILGAIAGSRGRSVAQLQAIAGRQGILSAREAKAAKLVDRISHPDEIEAELRRLTHPSGKTKHGFRQVSLSAYGAIAEANTHESSGSDRIAVVYAEGEITTGEGQPGAQVGSAAMVELLQDLQHDEAVKAVVLRINSPGGGATAASLIGREVQRLAQTKPLIVSMGDYAASGGYWIAAPARRIFAEATTITGSIGTYGLVPHIQGLGNRYGITWDTVATTPNANIRTLSRPKTPAEMALLQKSADLIYDQFLEVVSIGRRLPRSKVEAMASGRVWSGSDALSQGLVDELGGLEAAIAAAAQAAQLKENQWRVDEYPQPRSFQEALVNRLFSQVPLANGPSSDLAQGLPGPLGQEWRSLQRDMRAIALWNDPQHIYLKLPFHIEFR